jgi:polysaccharide biosynthesis transport protein
MELQEYAAILWRRKWVIIAALLMTEIVVILATFKTTPVYTASTMLRIVTSPTGSVNYTDYMYAERLMNTYVKLATTKPVLDNLRQQLGLDYLPSIGVDIISGTELLQIQVEEPNPVLAAQVANALADILVSQSVELYTGSGESSLDILSEQLKEMENELNQARKVYTDLVAKDPNDAVNIQSAKQSVDSKQQIYNAILEEYERARINAALREKSISVVEPSVPPSSPSRPNPMINIILGSLVGLLGGVGLAFLFENLDTTLYTPEQIEKVTKLPLLGTIPTIDARENFISMNGNTSYIDAFRRVRSNLTTLLQDSPCKTILVTSSEPGEGKSTLLTNLAYVMAQAGRKVVVIDGDLRRPTVHKIFKLPNEQGLSNVLCQKIDIEEVLQNYELPGVSIVTSGPLPPNPADLLGSEEMVGLKNRLRKKYDLVLIDSPAILSVSDAISLIPSVDGVILVASRSYSRRESVLNGCKQLADVNAHILGVVVNRVSKKRDYYYEDTRGLRGGITAILKKWV